MKLQRDQPFCGYIVAIVRKRRVTRVNVLSAPQAGREHRWRRRNPGTQNRAIEKKVGGSKNCKASLHNNRKKYDRCKARLILSERKFETYTIIRLTLATFSEHEISVKET